MRNRFDNQNLNSLSLADFIVLSFKRARSTPHKRALHQMACRLTDHPHHASAHRFSFDEKVDTILERLRFIPIEEFVSHHGRLVMPFDEFWIEQTPPVFETARHNRYGLLFQKNEGNDISAKFAVETEINPNDMLNPDVLVLDRFLRGVQKQYVVSATNIEVFFGNGSIRLDAKKATLKTEFKRAKGVTEADPLYRAFAATELKSHVESHQEFAEDMYRLLFLLSCHNVRESLLTAPLIAQATEGWNSYDRRRQPGSLLDPELAPIRIDLSPKLKKSLKDVYPNGMKALLGWTDVMGFLRHYYTREGIVEKIIAPHERRIAAPADRRGARRAMTSTTPDLSVQLDVERPYLTSGKALGEKRGLG